MYIHIEAHENGCHNIYIYIYICHIHFDVPPIPLPFLKAEKNPSPPPAIRSSAGPPVSDGATGPEIDG